MPPAECRAAPVARVRLHHFGGQEGGGAVAAVKQALLLALAHHHLAAWNERGKGGVHGKGNGPLLVRWQTCVCMYKRHDVHAIRCTPTPGVSRVCPQTAMLRAAAFAQHTHFAQHTAAHYKHKPCAPCLQPKSESAMRPLALISAFSGFKSPCTTRCRQCR